MLTSRKPFLRRARAAKVDRPAETAGLGQALVVEVSDPMTGAIVNEVSLAAMPDLDARASAASVGTRAFHVDGDCMLPIFRFGDLVFVRNDRPARPGRPAAVKVRGYGLAVKLWMPQGKDVRLVPTNRKYVPILVRASDVEWALEILMVVRFKAEPLQAAGGEETPRPAPRRARGHAALAAGRLASGRTRRPQVAAAQGPYDNA